MYLPERSRSQAGLGRSQQWLKGNWPSLLVACNNTKDSVEWPTCEELEWMPLRPFHRSIPLARIQCSPLLEWNQCSRTQYRLCHLQYPQLAGCFDTESLQGNVEKSTGDWGQEFFDACSGHSNLCFFGRRRHIVFNGPDEQFLGGRLMGAHAGIGGAPMTMPELFLKLNQLIAEKDWETCALQFINDIGSWRLTLAICSHKAVLHQWRFGLGIYSPLTPVVKRIKKWFNVPQLIQDTKPDSFDQRRSRWSML